MAERRVLGCLLDLGKVASASSAPDSYPPSASDELMERNKLGQCAWTCGVLLEDLKRKRSRKDLGIVISVLQSLWLVMQATSSSGDCGGVSSSEDEGCVVDPEYAAKGDRHPGSSSDEADVDVESEAPERLLWRRRGSRMLGLG